MPDISSLIIMDGGNLTTNQTLSECMIIFGNANHLLAEQALTTGFTAGLVTGIVSLFLGAKIYAKLQSNKP